MTTFDHATWQQPAPGHRIARLQSRRWLTCVRLLTNSDDTAIELRTGDDEESAVVVLSGTHDLEAAAGSWKARGLRDSPFRGRPVALFLPPKTPFRASGGRGDLLLVSGRRPAPTVAEPEPRPMKKPLLPLAGSNKAFDSETGSWQPIESFPNSAEAILPRRIEQRDVGGVATERVFPPEYKTAGLCLFEAVLADGQQLEVPGTDRAGDHPGEWAVYYRTTGSLRADAETLSRDGVLSGDATVMLTAVEGACYLAVAYSGPKPA